MTAWEPARPASLGIGPGDVHVWFAEIGGGVPALTSSWAVLAEDERARAVRFRSDLHRNRFVVARAALRRLLGSYLNCDPAAVALAYGTSGKPFLAVPPIPSALRFNVAHSDDVALFAFGMLADLGVDVEMPHEGRDLRGIAERFFSAAERAQVRRAASRDVPHVFYRIWTRKEAYLKAIGRGLAEPLDGLDVVDGSGDWPAVLRLAGGAGSSQWSLFDLPPAHGAVGALALPGTGWRVRTLQVRAD